MKERLILKKKNPEDHGTCNGCFFHHQQTCIASHLELCSSLEPFVYKLVEEPEEIPSEYEWKTQRYEALNKIGGSDTYDERIKLRKWLEENKPEPKLICPVCGVEHEIEENKFNDWLFVGASPDCPLFQTIFDYKSHAEKAMQNLIKAMENN